MTVEPRGPVHEAFAMPVTATAEPGIVVPKQPPEPIPEEPPEQKPAGDNVIWIPGYWAWDADRSDFLWVSGFWRVPPPERRWVPGYWTKVADGWQWVSGFWAPAEQQDLNYTPAPPASLDAGPTVPAPDDNSIYVPGIWVWRSTRFVWRPGYWLPAQPGWCWNPASYVWTPCGYSFVPGYWDYPLEDRGLLFAPVYFTRPLWTTPGWTYCPSYGVPVDGLLGSLFVWPASRHYWFGDWYGPRYERFGYRPWVTYGPRFHDPLFGYYNWRHRGDGWFQNLNAIHAGRLAGELARPPRTLREQNALVQSFNGRNNIGNTINIHNQRTLQTVTPLSQLARGNARLTTLAPAQRAQQRLAAQGLQHVGQQRFQNERLAARQPNPLTHPREAPITQTRLPAAPHTALRPQTGPGHTPGATAPPHTALRPQTGPAHTPGAMPAPHTGRQNSPTPFVAPRTHNPSAPAAHRPPNAPPMHTPTARPNAPQATPRPAVRTPAPLPRQLATPRPTPRPAATPLPRQTRPAAPAPRPPARHAAPAPRPPAAHPAPRPPSRTRH